LGELGWSSYPEYLKEPKGDPEKVRLARSLRQNTTMTLDAIAKRLQMGTAGHLSHLLYWADRVKPKRKKKSASGRLKRAGGGKGKGTR
jgi:hypothetical protein